MTLPEPIQVSCYAGSRGEETPRDFRTATAGRLLVVRVLGHWLQEGERRGHKDYFRIIASDGKTYTIYRDRSLDLWFLELVDSPGTT